MSIGEPQAMAELKYPDLTEQERARLHDKVTFTITCTMKWRWARQFLAMVTQMQKLGSWGSSRSITFFADGDGDFRPKFDCKDIPDFLTLANPGKEEGGNTWFDAG